MTLTILIRILRIIDQAIYLTFDRRLKDENVLNIKKSKAQINQK